MSACTGSGSEPQRIGIERDGARRARSSPSCRDREAPRRRASRSAAARALLGARLPLRELREDPALFLEIAASMSASVTQRGAVIDSPLPSIVKPIVRRAERFRRYSSTRLSSANVRTRERSGAGRIEGHCGCRFRAAPTAWRAPTVRRPARRRAAGPSGDDRGPRRQAVAADAVSSVRFLSYATAATWGRQTRAASRVPALPAWRYESGSIRRISASIHASTCEFNASGVNPSLAIGLPIDTVTTPGNFVNELRGHTDLHCARSARPVRRFRSRSARRPSCTCLACRPACACLPGT